MLASLLRPRRRRRRIDYSSPFTRSPELSRDRRGRPEQTSQDGEEEEDTHSHLEEAEGHDFEEEDEDEDDDYEPLLPIFSAAHLDTIPVYTTTHTIRSLIVEKCETTLSWDQLRSPQVSQFMVKPIQQRVRAVAFNRATLLALIANCLQFMKESEMNPGNEGVNKTRALLAELLAMRLLREYSTRELIDALSYDFNPLQGMDESFHGGGKQKTRGSGARISTVEISIRATAKRFLAHPLVVQQLEAIWAGSIVFHSAADNLHRKPQKEQQRLIKQRGYGTIENEAQVSPTRQVAAANGVKTAEQPDQVQKEEYVRRSVTLYDPRDASLFKLSRLRVPRYRHLFSTLSFAVMLGLFLVVLAERSLEITTLEIIFWFYSAGYMLDEVVGFSEQGFGLYILSVWNAFDLGILCMFIAYYILRLYGLFIENDRKHRIANMAYDVLASTAVLLFPRAFSVLDHYRYFSQLLIAFRLMAQDMVAILILIVISCSGFFVAFTLAFTENDTDGTHVAYALFQIVMGFSPAAWSAWDQYNVLGRIVLVIFLIICHFLVITILITVLTNSFMAIVRNANEEHQFLFAVNTISMVKSDALFSYIPPTNLLSWAISPSRFIIPFRQYVKLNRTVIKATHFPILFGIFVYERLVLSRIAYELTDLVEASARPRAQPIAFRKKNDPFNIRTTRLREPSVVSFRKDQALDEVFRRPYRGSAVHGPAVDGDDGVRRQSSHVVDTWMQGVGNDGGASPPMEQPRSIVDRLERRRFPFRRALTTERLPRSGRVFSTATRSVISDPEERSMLAYQRPRRIEEETDADISQETLENATEGEDGDDELLTHDEAEIQTNDRSSQAANSPAPGAKKDRAALDKSPSEYFSPTVGTPIQPGLLTPDVFTARAGPTEANPEQQHGLPRRSKPRTHDRTVSTNTILFSPALSRDVSSSSEAVPANRASRPATRTGTSTPAEAANSRTPRVQPPTSRARPIPTSRATFQSIIERQNGKAAPPTMNIQQRHRMVREPSLATMALDLASDLGDNKFGPSLVDIGGISGMPASFSEQLLRERELARRFEDDRRRSEAEEKQAINRVMLTRMNTLEEGFREVITAVREMRNDASRTGTGSEAGFGADKKGKRTVESAGSSSAGPLTAGLRSSGSGVARSPPKEKKSPKKIRRLQWLRGSSHEDDKQLGGSKIGAETMISLTAAVAPDTTDVASPVAQDEDRDIVGLQSPARKQVDATAHREGSHSSGSVKSIVETLERKSSEGHQSRTTSVGSQLRRVDTATYLPQHEQQGQTEVQPRTPSPSTRTQDEPGEGEGLAFMPESSSHGGRGDEGHHGGNRGSVIYIGPGPHDGSDGKREPQSGNSGHEE